MRPVISLFPFNNSGICRMSIRQLSIFLLLLNWSDCLSASDWWEKNASDPGRCFQTGMEFLFSLWTTWPILLIDRSSPKQCWAAHGGFVSTFLGKSQVSMMQPWCSPNYCLSRPGQVRVGTALTSSPPFPKTEHSSSPSEPGLGLPRTCQELKVVFFLPQEVIFLGTAALGCQSLGFTKAHVCVTVALLLGMLEFPFQIDPQN